MSAITAAVVLGAGARRHLVRALEDHRCWCRGNGVRFPADLEQLAALVASDGQERPTPPGAGGLVDTAPVAIALTYEDAAAVLSVSERTIRRLVEEGRLRAITIGGPRTRRIHRDDLVAYADSLRQQEAS